MASKTENIDDSDVSEESTGPQTYDCPKCGEPQTYYIDRGRGWARCPSCDTGIQKKEVPEEMLRKVDYSKFREEKKKEKEPDYLELEDEGVVFNRPREMWEILSDVLHDFKVNEKAISIVIKRCQRSPLQPQDVQRMLQDLKTGLQKKEINYVVDEYFYAVESERKKFEGSSVPGYMRVGAGGNEQRFDSPPDNYKKVGELRGDQRPWERNKGPQYTENMTRVEFEREWNRRENERAQKEEITGLKGFIENMNQKLSEMQTGIVQNNLNKSNEDNNGLMMQMMKMQQEHSEKMMLLLKDNQTSEKNHLGDMLEIYKDQASSKPAQISTEGYKDDGARLLADSINAATTAITQNKPVKTMAQVMAAAKGPESQPLEDNPVERKKKEELGILSDIPKELIDEE